MRRQEWADMIEQESDMVGKLDEALRFNATALTMREQRQQLLASNIANADTPNFKARDIDFTKALKGALDRPAGAQAGGALVTTAAAHLGGAGSAKTTAGGAPLLYRT